jgi:hypothetical protein
MRTLPRNALAALPVLLTLPACTGVEPAILGAAVSGASTGATILTKGRMNAFEYARFEEVAAASETAANDLGLRELNRRDDQPDRRWYYYRYSDWQKLEVEITRQTPTVTKVETTVRSEEHRGMATLFLRHLYVELERRGAILDRAGQRPVGLPAAD